MLSQGNDADCSEMQNNEELTPVHPGGAKKARRWKIYDDEERNTFICLERPDENPTT